MAYNYNTTGLNVDFGGSLLKGYQIKNFREQSEALKQKQLRDAKYRELYSQYRQTNDPKMLRQLMGLDSTQTKAIMDMDQQLSDVEKQSLADTALESKFLFDNGMVKEARQLWVDRQTILSSANSSSSFTQPLANAAQKASDDDFGKILDSAVNTAQGMGIIELPDLSGDKLGDYYDSKGRQFIKIQGKDGTIRNVYTGDTRQAQEDAEMRKSAIKNAGTPLDLGKDLSELRVDTAMAARQASSRARQAEGLIQRFDSIDFEGEPYRKGTVGRAVDFALGFVGEEDATTILRRDADALLVEDVIARLPKGAASDKDVALVRGTVPDPYTNPDEFKNWLGAYKRISEQAAESNLLYSEWVERTASATSSAIDTTVAGVGVKRGETFQQFQKRLYSQRDKKRREMEEREKQIGQELGVDNLPAAPKPTAPLNFQDMTDEEFLKMGWGG